jgi:hypothetical protein
MPGSTTFRDTSAARLRTAFYRVGTSSTNPPPTIRVEPPVFVGASVTLTWSSVADRSYAIERATNLGAAAIFFLVRSNIAGLQGTTSCTDDAPGPGPRFYRVRVQN